MLSKRLGEKICDVGLHRALSPGSITSRHLERRRESEKRQERGKGPGPSDREKRQRQERGSATRHDRSALAETPTTTEVSQRGRLNFRKILTSPVPGNDGVPRTSGTFRFTPPDFVRVERRGRPPSNQRVAEAEATPAYRCPTRV